MKITDTRNPSHIVLFSHLAVGDEFVMLGNDGNEIHHGLFIKMPECKTEKEYRQNAFCLNNALGAYHFDDTTKVKRVDVECVVSDFTEE